MRELAEVAFQVGGEAGDLFLLVLRRNADQNGLVEAAADHFDLTALDQMAQFREIFRAIFFEPQKQWAGIVKRGVNVRMFFEKFDEGEIGFFVAGRQNVVEIAAGLVGVDEESEVELWWHGRGASLYLGYYPAGWRSCRGGVRVWARKAHGYWMRWVGVWAQCVGRARE